MCVRFGHHVAMAITAARFVSRLTSAVPESLATLREHLADQEGELLLHVLMGDLLRLALIWFREGRTDALTRLLAVLEAGLREGDEYVSNAVAVSFVEDIGWWEAGMRPFITTLPGELAKEVERQRQWYRQ